MNTFNLLHRNIALKTKSEERRREYSEYAAFKKFHFNTLRKKIKKIELSKKECHGFNILYLLCACFFGVAFLKSETNLRYIALFIMIILLMAFRYFKYSEWSLLVTYKDKDKAYYKMMKNEKKEALELVLNFKNNFSHDVE
jgi:hypothetical protein